MIESENKHELITDKSEGSNFAQKAEGKPTVGLKGYPTLAVLEELIATACESNGKKVVRKTQPDDGIKKIVAAIKEQANKSKGDYTELCTEWTERTRNLYEVALRLLGGDHSWGKIALFLQFAQEDIAKFKEGDLCGIVKQITSYLTIFHADDWIMNKGGWEAITKNRSGMIAAASIAALGAAAVGGIMYARRKKN